jgi:hypothetical protein
VATSLGSLVARSTEGLTVLTAEHSLHLAIAGRLFLQPQTAKAREVTLTSDRTIILQTRVRIGAGILVARGRAILGQGRALVEEDVE